MIIWWRYPRNGAWLIDNVLLNYSSTGRMPLISAGRSNSPCFTIALDLKAESIQKT